MKIYVDADACPNVIKDILYRAVERVKIPMVLVANQFLRVPKSELISSIMVDSGLDVADDKIVELVEQNDLVITADIPLASEVIAKGGHALNPRGEMYTKLNISQRLSMRDFMSELRSCGIETGGPAAFSKKDGEKFANALNRFLCKYA